MKKKSAPTSKLPDMTKTRELYQQQLPFLEESLHLLYQEVRKLLERHGFTPTIKYRVKRFDAYYDKLRRIRIDPRAGNRSLGDFFALRIICPFLEDIETVERLLTTHFHIVDNERKSAQHSFREFGYDSVHLLLKPEKKLFRAAIPGVRNFCEVQLRTILQDAWAEIEHELVYKSDINLPKESIRRKLASLNATLTLSDLIFQEIRDYQHELRRHGRKRRETILESSLELDLINISAPPGNGPKPIPSTLKSRLETSMLKALEAHSNGDLDGAIALYGVILNMKLDRNIRGLVYNHRGMAWFSLGNYRQALSDFNQAIRFAPGNDRTYANRGLCNRVLKRFDKAIPDFDTAIQINPASAEHLFGRAQTYHDLQQIDLVVVDCRRALDLDPGFAPASDLLSQLSKED